MCDHELTIPEQAALEMKVKSTDEMLTGYSKILDVLTEQGRWQAQRIRELETALAKSAEAQDRFCGRWLRQAMLAQQYKQDSNGHKKSCADALARSLEATEECLRMGAENERLRDGLERIAKGAWTSSGDLAGATWDELIACRIAKQTLERSTD